MKQGIDPDAKEHVDIISCANCNACCCRLEVLLMGEDDVPVGMTVQDRWGASVMGRRDDGWCAALDRNTLRCTIYARRPTVCRDYEVGGSDCIVERHALRPAADTRGRTRRP